MRFILLLLLLTNTLVVRAMGTFEFSPDVKTAYELALSLRLDEAQQHLNHEKLNNPDNLLPLLIEDYIDFFTVFINENKAEFDRLEPNKNRRLDLIRNGNPNSPYYLYAQAEITLHWALIRLKFEQNLTAAREVRRAYKLLEENTAKYPDFMAGKKTLGLLHAIIGTIPDNYRWVVKMVGMEGTVEQGKRELQEVIRYAQVRPDFLFGQETVVMYALLMVYIGNDEAEAWTVVSNADINVEDNPLAAFILANVAMHNGRNDEAIDILERAPRGATFHQFHYLDFMLGLGKLYRLDDDADEYLQRYVDNFNGQNYIKEAYQKLAWYELLFGTEQGYHKNMQYCHSKGKGIMESDKKAEKEAIEGLVPNRDLIEARLLFDGGYYDKSLNILRSKTTHDFRNERQLLEYLYRLGRVYHKKKNTEKAIEYYQKVIHEGSDKPWYFACSAALRTGNIYESQGNYAQARVYYKKCLALYPDEYRNGLHQHAKAGLNRMKKY